MKATVNNIQYIAEGRLYREVADKEFTMTISFGMWDKANATFRVENEEGEKVESETISVEALCEKINNEGWEFNESHVAEEMAIDGIIENAPEVTPVPQQYTCKNGYVMNVWFVDATMMDKSSWYEIENKVKALRGWFDKKQGGYILRSESDAKAIIDMIY